ncbi:biotin/lipoyl-binding protein [Dyella nitratireducens]|uniref:Antibiotic resistance protein n=1 Tax=Dyella nitratireducens TaxID=1849580 RepID=A0ABQ1G6U5_9GAMM|nr:HlyD family secretion protein [Dyella nitratireducens]GGA37872.1 antibiotic resistance protein [Dyella nitratireducens]GLQ40238.1 antibiotic resistance protein [Dyella nitratireducens]
MKNTLYIRIAITAVLVLLAAFIGYGLWRHYMYSPWTRDGRIRANVVRIAPDVAGLVTAVNVVDNQQVKQGDVLFVIDRPRYEDAFEQAKANLAAAQASVAAAQANIDAAKAATTQSKANFTMYEAQSRRRQSLRDVVSNEDIANASATADAARATWDKARAGIEQAIAAQQQAQAAVKQAQAALATAELNLQRTEVRAPVDGYVTNLLVRVGDYASAGAPRLAIIDSRSFWVDGYFEETKLPHLHVGDPVDIRLMAGGVHLRGTVEGVARGIGGAVDPTGNDLLANINPTFNWVRLAQRVPVRVRIDTDHMPAGTVLVAGQTATLVVQPGGHGDALAESR